ncbi:MAG: DUF2911 domain-containing protein [Bacteroidota bacterium]
MKRLTRILFVMGLAMGLSTLTVSAQISTPAPSPGSKIEQAVGLSTISIDYSRPGKKGREIFGDLVPYDKIWRTGANASTKITFSDDATVNGNKVPAGTYAIYTKPGKDKWTIMLYKDLRLGGNVGGYKAENELARFDVEPTTLPFSVESFTIMTGNLTSDAADVSMMWDNVMVSMNVKVEVDKRVMANIERVMAGPAGGDYYQAALYYYNTDRDMDQAIEWINKAIDSRETPPFWMVTWKARMLGKKGDKMAAVAASKKAMELAKEAGNADYVKINEDLLAGWQ